jgi:hypothetical protein
VEYEELSTIKGPEVYVDFEDGRKIVWYEILNEITEKGKTLLI